MRHERMQIVNTYTDTYIYSAYADQGWQKEEKYYLTKFCCISLRLNSGWEYALLSDYQRSHSVSVSVLGQKTVQFAEVFISILCTYVYIHTSALQ